MTFSIEGLIATFRITTYCHYGRCLNAECCVLLFVMLNAIMLSVVILSVIMLSVIMLSVIMLNVVALCIPDVRGVRGCLFKIC
jgi:hypothetical protein